MKIGFICHGNVNRSRAAEEILKSMGHKEVESFAVGLKSKGGRPITKKMRTILEEAGIPYNKEVRSRVITMEDIERIDLLYVMDSGNLKNFKIRFGDFGNEKIRLLPELIGMKRIADPGFSKGTEKYYEACHSIQQACAVIIEKLSSNEKL